MAVSQDLHRVALVSSSFHPYVGGVEEHVRQVARVLAERGHAVEVWTVDRGEHLGTQVVEGVTVRYLPTPLPARRVSNLARFAVTGPVALAKWLQAVRKFRPDVLHVHCFGPNGPYARVAAKVSRVPLVVTSHGETFADQNDIFNRSALLRRELRKACTFATAVTGVSSIVTDDLVQNFGATDVMVVPNGVRAAQPRGGEERLDPHGSKVAVAVGRLVHVKGFDLLLEAVRLSTKTSLLRIIGDGPERAALVQLAERLEVSDRVDFAGQRSPDEVQQIMAEADVVVVPSRREAFGIVALEAWVTGTPLVASSLTGPAGFVTDGVDGILVNPQDAPALAGAIDAVLGSPARAQELAAHGLETVRDFTWERVVDHYETIYLSVPTE